MDSFERDDCGAYVYPNGFKMPLEETGNIFEAAELWHGGQWSFLYALMSSGHATPSTICGAARELERAVDTATRFEPVLHDPDDIPWQAVEDLNTWADGVSELLED